MELNNSSKDKHSWFVVYLFYEDLNEILTEIVTPIVQYFTKKNYIEQFFFIRYWENGPHIRIRFKGEHNVLENKVKSKILKAAETFNKRKATINFNNKLRLLFEQYVPEIDRYGGEDGMLISEKLFQASSITTLEVMSKTDKLDYSWGLKIAIMMHISFAFAVGMNARTAQIFYSTFTSNWQSRALPVTDKNVYDQMGLVHHAYHKLYLKQEKELVKLAKEFCINFKNKKNFKEKWLNHWVNECHQVNMLLLDTFEKDKLYLPKEYKLNIVNIPETKYKIIFAVFDSYVHMTNNRLGVLNQDEGYISYMLANIFNRLSLDGAY